MSRIRSIHPDLATDESFMTMSMVAKAAWPLLWTECDDRGVFEWKPIVLKARLFPADAVDFAAVLEEFERLGCVVRFDDGARCFGAVRNFCRFQSPKRPTYRHPAPPKVREFVAFKGGESLFDPPGLTHASPTPPGIPPLMEREREKDRENNIPPPPTRPDGGEGEFDRFWDQVPRDAFSSRPRALAAWRDLNAEERAQAIAALPALKSAKPTTHKLQPARYLAEKMFAAHVPRQARETQVKVERQSAQGEAWELHLKATRGKGAPWAGGAWWFPTEWPPGHEAAP